MTVERTLLDRQREAADATNPLAAELQRRRLLREGWSPESLDAERRFGKRCARLYAYVGRENAVVCSLGPASLLQVFADSPGSPGAMVLPLRPKAFIEEVKHGKRTKRAAAVFVNVEDVKPYRKETG